MSTNSLCFWRNAAVDTEELPVDDGAERQRVERGEEGVVELGTVLVHALFAEREEHCHVAALVVAADEKHCAGPRDLEAVQEQQDLHTKAAAVDIVAQEQVRCGVEAAAHLQQL